MPQPDPSDFPPESFFLAKDAESDWIDRNAFIERKDSGKGGSSSSSSLLPSSASQRYCLTVKSKPSIIGLPKSQKAAYGDAKHLHHHRRPPSVRLFPKRSHSISSSNSGRKTEDPSSPKVSCIGRVRSRRDRKIHRQKNPPEPVMKRSKSIKIHKAGFWGNFMSIFGSKGHKQVKADDDEQPPDPPAAAALKKTKSLKKRKSLRKKRSSSPSAAEPPSLVAVLQFTSGRRSDAWAAELEGVDGGPKV